MNTPKNAESAAAATPSGTTQNLGVAAPTQNSPTPPSAIPGEQEQEHDQEQESGKEKTPAKPEQVALSPVLGTLDLLSEVEQAELFACEAIIGTGWDNFVQVGLALARIRDLRLYRTEFGSFEAGPNGTTAGARLIT